MTKINAKTVLQSVRAMIANEDHWCQQRYAEDACGCEDDPVSGNPVAFCPLGAARRVIGVPWGIQSEVFLEVSDALYVASHAADGSCEGIAEFNDYHSHAEVLRVIDEAIQNFS
jgi:hypothetical protein